MKEVKKMKKNLIVFITGLLLIIQLFTAVGYAQGDINFYNEELELVEGTDEAKEETVFIDEKVGTWEYKSSALTVKIQRNYEEKQNITWYLAEILSTDQHLFRCISAVNEKLQWPATIAQENSTVFAINSDFHHLRVANKSRTGVIIRDGVIVGEKTYEHNKGKFPNLDTMAIYPDGRLEVYPSDAYKAQEYLDMGAIDVLAFGPYLIKDGQLNETALAKYGKSHAPRTGIGMVKPGHYYAIMVEGRHSRSDGTGVSFLTEKLFEQGCTTGFNLDGGQTATMIFMGDQIVKIGQTEGENASARKCGEIIGIGTSTLVGPK